MISKTLQSKFEDSKILNAATVHVVVQLENSSLMKVLSDKLLAELVRVCPYAGYEPIAELESRDIERYLNTLTWMRVCAVTNSTDKSWSAYRPLKKYVAVPVLVYQLLLGIGVAYDKDFNLEFIPAYNVTQDDILSPDEMDKVSSLFRQFEQSGIKLVYGIPKGIEGELEFMSMSHVKEEVLSYRRNHPAYGFLAAFFKQQELNEVTGMMCRVLYGYETDYRYQIDALFNSIEA